MRTGTGRSQPAAPTSVTHRLARPVALGVLIGLVLAAAVSAGLWMTGGPALATHGSLTIGVDADPTGNTATSLGASDTCRTVAAGSTFEIDIYVTEVIDLLSWEAYLSYNQDVLRVDNRALLFQEAHSNNVSDTSGSTPNTSGLYRVGGVDMNANTPGSGANGDGVLARITLFAIGYGSSELSIEPIDLNGDGSLDSSSDIGPWLKNASGDLINDADANGFFDGPIGSTGVFVGAIDSDGDSLPDICDPDIDNDGVCNTGGPLPDGTPGTAPGGCAPGPTGVDNCPAAANPDQANLDGDAAGDSCDPDDDNDGHGDAKETEMGSDPLNATSTPEVCDGIDNDGDTSVDEGYDRDSNGIPDCGDPSADTDGDGVPNPSDTDDDNDGFSDGVENYMATDSLIACSATSTVDAWGPDINRDRIVDILDVGNFKPAFLTSFGQDFVYLSRLDLNADGAIDVFDVNTLKPLFFATCTP